MTTWPLDTFWDTSKTEGEASSGWFYKTLDAWKELPGGAESFPELTIASGSITPTYSANTIDTESDAASDDLNTIAVTNTPEGRRLLLKAENDARTVVLKHEAGGSGQISMIDGADFSLDNDSKYIELILKGTTWEEVSRGDDFATSAALTSGLGTKQDTITGAATTITSSNLTASRALVSNGSGKVEASPITSTELGYLDGLTELLSTSLAAKLSADSILIPKARGNVLGAGTIVSGSTNISSVTRSSNGVYIVYWDTDFADTNYDVHITCGTANRVAYYESKAVGSVTVKTINTAPSALDSDFSIIAYGDQ